ERPVMFVHGLSDDNVVFAHTQRMSSALLAAGRPHTVLPLSGVTHSPSDPTAAENLLLLQVEFLKERLGVEGEVPGPRTRNRRAAGPLDGAVRASAGQGPAFGGSSPISASSGSSISTGSLNCSNRTNSSKWFSISFCPLSTVHSSCVLSS